MYESGSSESAEGAGKPLGGLSTEFDGNERRGGDDGADGSSATDRPGRGGLRAAEGVPEPRVENNGGRAEMARIVRVVRDRGHWYAWNGTLYPSVSTLLKGWPQPALVGWAAKQTAEFAVRNRQQVWAVAEADEAAAIALVKNARFNTGAMKRGTDIHALIATGGKATEAEQPYIDAYHRWLEEHQVEVVAHEVPIINQTIGYGGTCDLVANFMDMSWVIDLKTGSGVYSEHHAQVAAYCKAEHGLPIEVKAGGVLLLSPDGPQLHMVDIDAAFDAFQHSAAVAKYCGLVKEPEMEESPYV